MKISEILSRNCVFSEIAADNKRELLFALSAKVAQAANADERLVSDFVWERESLGSTGYGRGTAFPHARIDGINQLKAVFAKLATPIEFDSVDNKPVDLVFLLISPENSGADHLSALAAVSRILKSDTVCQQLREAKNAEEIYNILTSL